MIYLHTGQPGAGKTLLTLWMVRKRAEEEGRPVFYAGIELLKPELYPNWQKLDDPSKWYELPDGAIIVHDEAQGLYRPRGNGAQVPKHVAELETHRHKGFDIYFITQHPMLIDSNVRRLAGEHCHIVRAFGTNVVTTHRWMQVKEQCDKTRADSIRETRTYPAEIIGSYKSASIHTHKRKLPARVYALALVPLLLIACGWAFYQWFQATDDVAVQGVTPSGTGAAAIQTAGQFTERKGRTLTTAEWIEARTPRIEGLPHTAPVFDDVTKPTIAPRPAACVQWPDKGCRCYTQQGTRIDTPDYLCNQIVQRGYFLEWDDDRGRRRDESPQLAQAAIRE